MYVVFVVGEQLILTTIRSICKDTRGIMVITPTKI